MILGNRNVYYEHKMFLSLLRNCVLPVYHQTKFNHEDQSLVNGYKSDASRKLIHLYIFIMYKQLFLKYRYMLEL